MWIYKSTTVPKRTIEIRTNLDEKTADWTIRTRGFWLAVTNSGRRETNFVTEDIGRIGLIGHIGPIL